MITTTTADNQYRRCHWIVVIIVVIIITASETTKSETKFTLSGYKSVASYLLKRSYNPALNFKLPFSAPGPYSLYIFL